MCVAMCVAMCVSVCVTDDGVVFAWGNNEYGQLALNTSELQVAVPQQCWLPLLSDRVVNVASGGAFTCFLTGYFYYIALVQLRCDII